MDLLSITTALIFAIVVGILSKRYIKDMSGDGLGKSARIIMIVALITAVLLTIYKLTNILTS